MGGPVLPVLERQGLAVDLQPLDLLAAPEQGLRVDGVDPAHQRGVAGDDVSDQPGQVVMPGGEEGMLPVAPSRERLQVRPEQRGVCRQPEWITFVHAGAAAA